MLTVNFWSDALQRSVRTFAQTLLAGFGGAALNVWNADWKQMIGLGLGASFISLLMAIDRNGHSSQPATVIAEEQVTVTPLPAGEQVTVTPMMTVACGDQLK